METRAKIMMVVTFVVAFLLTPIMFNSVLASPVPDTGQTKCYDNRSEITCPSPGQDFYGQDGSYDINTQSYTKLDANGNDLPDEATEWIMIRDNVTGLIWENKTDDNSIHDKDNAYNWYDAQSVFIATLNSQNFGGHNDWRLPTIKELSTIVDSSIPYPGPTINSDYFPNTVSSYYWSSTTGAYDPSHAWSVIFGVGYIGYHFKSYYYYVRAVRGGQCGSFDNFIDNGDGTVTSTDTGLMWQKATALGTPTWQQALSYCENLTLAGYNDWRLPNRNELQSLVDYTRYDPAINTDYFPDTASNYWSSTTYAGYPGGAWGVPFGLGYIYDYYKSDYDYVRAVRGGQCGLPDLSIDSVTPIQVIEGIPLVKDKATMVRVKVKLEGTDKLENITCRLDFGGEIRELTKTLINYDGTTYVLPASEVTVQNFENKRDTIETESFKNLYLKPWKFNYGIDAYNFEDPKKQGYPLYPQNGGSISINATIDPPDPNHPKGMVVESNENNNSDSVSKNVKIFNGDFNIVFRPLSIWGRPEDFDDYNGLENFAEKQFEYLIATYPIPKVNGQFLFDKYNAILKGGTWPIASWALSPNFTNLYFQWARAYKHAGFDRVVYVVPKDGISWPGGGILGLRVAPINLFVFVDETAPQKTTTHEIGHTYTYCDEYDASLLFDWGSQCNDWDGNNFPHGYPAGDGWDVSHVIETVSPPKISCNRQNPAIFENNYFSFMNPAGSWAPNNDYENKYNTLLDQLGVGSDPRLLLVSGLIYDDDTVALQPFSSLDGIPDEAETGDYSFECLSATDEVLSSLNFQPRFHYDQVTDKNVSPLFFTIPYPIGTTKIRLKHNTTILQEVIVTPNSPVVNITSLNNLGNENYQVIWNASDPDSDPLTYSILYTHNDDVWLPIEHGTTTTPYDYTFNTSTLPGGSNSKIKIVTTDGVNTVETVSNPFSVPIKIPSASIQVPSDESVFVHEREVTFKGYGYDPEDGLLGDSSLVWTSNIDGEIGTGGLIGTSTLSLGVHTITLTATDSQIQYATAQINITVEEELDGDGVPDSLDICPSVYNPFQEDTYPLQGNGIGDACDCEANFDCDADVDANDVTAFLTDFGRSQYNRPCTNEDPCKGDFSCDGDVDANDVSKFLEDFGRSQYSNSCPQCEAGDWCLYP